MRTIVDCCSKCGKARRLTAYRLGVGRRFGSLLLCVDCAVPLIPYLELVAAPDPPMPRKVSDPALVVARRGMRR